MKTVLHATRQGSTVTTRYYDTEQRRQLRSNPQERCIDTFPTNICNGQQKATTTQFKSSHGQRWSMCGFPQDNGIKPTRTETPEMANHFLL